MGLFDFLNKKGETQHVPEDELEINLEMQQHMAPIAMDMVRNLSFDEEPREVEFFFYTNAMEKAEHLASELKKINYVIYDIHESLAAGQLCISGHTPIMAITDEAMVAWVNKMCELGYVCDCNFDGWGMLTFLD